MSLRLMTIRAIRCSRSIVAWTALLLAAGPAVAAEQPVFESWTTENGLPQNSVNDILQTRDGYLWLATFGGLVRFDGARFVIFDRSVEGIENQRVFSLYEDAAGTLWAGTDTGMLIRYRDGAFTTFTPDDDLPPSGLHRIEEVDGILWIYSVGGLMTFDGERFVSVSPAHFDHRVRPPPVERYLDAWWSEQSGVVSALVAGRVRTYTIGHLIGEARVTRVNRDRAGNLWINTDGDVIVKAKGDHLERLTAGEGLPDSHADTLILEGGDGELWLADAERVYRVKAGRHELVRLPGTPASVLRSLFADREGTTWIGTTASGLHRLTDPTVTLYDERDDVSLRVSYAILQDRAGAVWISTNGLHRLAHGRAETIGTPRGVPGRVTSLYQDAAGTLWVGTDRGLSYVEGGRWLPSADRTGLLRTPIWAMAQDASGATWYATTEGLVRAGRDEVQRFTAADGLSHTHVSALLAGRDGELWIGTFQGLTRLAAGAFRAYTGRDGFVGTVRALHQDRDGILWIGTYDGGLYRLTGERLTRFTRADGLHDNGVFQILEDDDGFLWMGSNRGIQRISRRELNELAAGRRRFVTPLVLGARDGLTSVEVNGGRQPAGLRTADGRLWFPTMAGVAIVDPTRVRPNLPAPRTLIEEVRVAGATVDISRGVSVPSDASAIDVRYTAPMFVRPDSVRFRHRILGLQDEWNEAGERREASFYGLPPGRYAFQVMATGGGEWSESASVELVVLPPFWRTRWFFALSVSAIAAVAVAGHRLRVRRLQKLQTLREAFSHRLIENQERERARIAGDMHDSLGQSLRIIRKLARTSQHEPAARTGDEALVEIAGLAERTQVELTEIAYGLRPRQLDVLGLSKTIDSLIRRVERSCGIRFVTEIAAIDDRIPEDARIHLFRIVQEAISNILHHSNATEARVALDSDARHVQLTIDDNGDGFTPSTVASHERAGGLGLMGMRERARIIGAEVSIRSAPGRGTTIGVTLPAAGRRDA